MNLAYLNGQFVPEADAFVSIFDRSFLYGDGLFETVRVYGGQPFRWTQHLERLRAGARFLGIRPHPSDAALTDAATELLRRNASPEAMLRVHLSRGVGRRGYSPKGAEEPTLVMTLHPASANDPANPVRWKLCTASFRLPAGDRLASFKTANKLVQILARTEAEDRGCDEAVLLNTDGLVAEGASSNLFWIEGAVLCTPPLAAGALAGITRAFLLELAPQLGLPVAERTCYPGRLASAEGVFLTVSSLEVVPAVSLDGLPLPESPVIRRIHEAYHAEVRSSFEAAPAKASS